MPKMPIEWVLAEAAMVVGDRLAYQPSADETVLAGIERGILFVFENSGTPRISLKELAGFIAAADPDQRLTLTVVPIQGAKKILSLPAFADVVRGQGVVAWIRHGQIVTASPATTGAFDGKWKKHTHALVKDDT